MSHTRTATTIFNVDFLRGIAALAVLVWHYQHFFYPSAGDSLAVADRPLQPFYPSLRWLYDYGANGVQFFWVLSGFVFFHAYRSRENISFKKFFINRFSRLYPLHFITLLLIALLQIFSQYAIGHQQIYPFNDFYHFILNIFLASHWGFQKGYSFNTPIWSVSIEIITYILFFAYLKTAGIRLCSALVWLAVIYVAFQGPDTSSFAQCTILFALGGLVHELHFWINSRAPKWISPLGAITLTTSLLVYLYVKGVWNPTAVVFALFPSLIWLAASVETIGLSSGRIGEVIGNTTYASYLIHVPIQVAFMTVADLFLINRIDIAKTPIFFFFYIAIVLLLSHFIFEHVELPLKGIIKIWLNQKLFKWAA
ncbi:acyltransferase [Comamonas testosteroni]